MKNALRTGVYGGNFESKNNRQLKNHLGNILKKSIADGYYSYKEIAMNVGVAYSTLYRWLESPNLSEKQIARIGRANPKLDLRKVYAAFELITGKVAESNPYGTVVDSPSTDLSKGVFIRLDAVVFSSYKIPPNLNSSVVQLIEEYNDGLKMDSEDEL